ncbi:MAG: X2-like carbohydrate binding domain-containing protein [Bacteroidales bacterium]|nr:X2-like carbohydrate binding domain-containing protein [Bacteroidales bacterium]
MKLNFYYVQIMKKILLFTVISVFSSIFAFGQSISPEYQNFSILEPDDVQFSINWGGESQITAVYYYYWDESNNQQQVMLNQGTAYTVVGNTLTILQTWIESVPPEPDNGIHFYANLGTEHTSHFNVKVIYTYYPYVFEDSKEFDLSNKDDVFVTITLAESDAVTSVSVDGTPIPASNYEIFDNWFLTLTEEYLNTVLLAVGNSIDVTVNFDNEYSDVFEIEAINTGVTNPSLSQYDFNLPSNDMPEYIETIITWNAASEVSSMEVTMSNGGYYIETMAYEDYTVTPINASTAILRVYMGGAKTSEAKETDYFYASVEIVFDAGSPLFIFLAIYDEYYYVGINSIPQNGGWTDGTGEYDVDEPVTITAYPSYGFTFSKWIINETQEVTDNPYNFDMPANDVNIDAIFISDYPTVLSSNPHNEQNDVDINSSIYLTFDRDIIEGTTNNGFDDIQFQDGMSNPWPINSISIMSGNILVIEPNLPLNINTSYHLNIPPEAVEDAANPGLYMNNPYWLNFSTGWGDYEHGLIEPEENFYSLMNPEDVDFDIIWGDDTSISAVYYYYWDEFYEYQQVVINTPTDYVVNGNVLSITNAFVSSLNLDIEDYFNFYAEFESGWQSHFRIRVVQTTLPHITPDAVSYDLSNPNDVFTTIIYNTAELISSVSLNSVNLIQGTDYHINGAWLFIHNSYLSTRLSNVNDEISLDVIFNTQDLSTLTITAIQSGIISATIDPESETITNIDIIEYIDLTITWNDASSVLSLTIWEEDNGILTSFDFTDYTVTAINAETANLRIFVGAKKLNYAKATDEYNVSIEIEFNVGAPAFYYLTVIDEFYFLYMDVYPANTGNVQYDHEYYLNEEVYLLAEPNFGYEFLYWKIDGVTVSTDNPYIFNMPANDIYMTAHFVPQGAILYDVILVSNPVGAGVLSGAGQYTVGETVTINLIENTGYEFVNWTDSESNVVASTTGHSFVMVDQSLTLTANFNDNSNVDEIGFDALEIYPNPFSDILYISNYQSAIKITFTTITGQIIAEIKNPENGQINTADLPKGFYMLIIENIDGKRLVKKIVKQ